MNNACILHNPPISETVYPFVKVLRVETVDTGQARPKILIEMRAPGLQPQLSGERLYSIIHPTADYPFQKFRECFRIAGKRYHDAEGQWVAIRLVPNTYNGTPHSVVQYVQQTDISRIKAQRFREAEEAGELPDWDAGDCLDQHI